MWPRPPQLGQVWACSEETEPEPPQCYAGIEARVADGLAGTALGLLGVEFDIDDHIGAVLGIIGSLPTTLLAPGATKGKAALKGIAIACAAGVAATIGRSRRGTGKGIARTHGVVARTFLLIRKHGVGLGNLFKLFLGIRLFVDVRMELAGLLLEGLLNITRGGVLGDTQNLVVIFSFIVAMRGNLLLTAAYIFR